MDFLELPGGHEHIRKKRRIEELSAQTTPEPLLSEPDSSEGILPPHGRHGSSQDASDNHRASMGTEMASPPRHHKKQKLPKLPKYVTVTRRPLHRPAIPHPHSSSLFPKTLYIKYSTPFIPAVKRIRALLLTIASRAHQSSQALAKNNRRGLKADGRLEPKDVEREIAEEARQKKNGAVSGEKVYLKATGRAISRALEIGVFFQREADCEVRVELGSVRAIDDLEVRDTLEQEGDEGDGEAMDVDNGDFAQKENARSERDEAEDIPESRMRMLSAVTVTIGLK